MDELVLLVEDEKQTRDIILKSLEDEGYKVIATPRGDKAIQIAIREKPDLVILDIMLEGPLDGYSVARSLNVLDETNAPYIIFLSTKKEVRDRIQGFATGAHDFISKNDFSSDEFLARVENGLRIKKTHDSLRDRSNIDGLTNLFNHRFFMEELNREVEKTIRLNMPLSLAFLDVDDFKMFNDRFGHYAGDRVLAQIADIIKKSCRTSDISARYGGEEFTIILPTTDIQGAQIVMERIRKAIEHNKFPVRGSGVSMEFEKVTVSIGIASYFSGLSPQLLIEYSDKKALYRAKSAGKNRIYVFVGFDDQGKDILIDAAGRKPDHIDISSLLYKLKEVEAKVLNMDEPQFLKPLTRARKEIETLAEDLKQFYQKRIKDNDETES